MRTTRTCLSVAAPWHGSSWKFAVFLENGSRGALARFSLFPAAPRHALLPRKALPAKTCVTPCARARQGTALPPAALPGEVQPLLGRVLPFLWEINALLGGVLPFLCGGSAWLWAGSASLLRCSASPWGYSAFLLECSAFPLGHSTSPLGCSTSPLGMFILSFEDVHPLLWGCSASPLAGSAPPLRRFSFLQESVCVCITMEMRPQELQVQPLAAHVKEDALTGSSYLGKMISWSK